MQELLNEINMQGLESYQHSDDIHSFLLKIGECVFPNEKAEEQFSIDLDSCNRWAEKLMEALRLIMLLKLFFSYKIVQEIDNEDKFNS